MFPLLAQILARVAPGILARIAPSAALAATTSAATPVAATAAGTAASKIAPAVLSKLKGIGGIAAGAGGVALPLILQLIGGGVSGLSRAAGAGISGLSRIPAALAGTPEAKKELYGATPLDKAGDAVTAIGDAVGGGAAALGEEVGKTVSDIGNTGRLMQLQKELQALDVARLTQLQKLNLNPSVANLYSRMLQERGGSR